jgi:hypothetical protein
VAVLRDVPATAMWYQVCSRRNKTCVVTGFDLINECTRLKQAFPVRDTRLHPSLPAHSPCTFTADNARRCAQSQPSPSLCCLGCHCFPRPFQRTGRQWADAAGWVCVGSMTSRALLSPSFAIRHAPPGPACEARLAKYVCVAEPNPGLPCVTLPETLKAFLPLLLRLPGWSSTGVEQLQRCRGCSGSRNQGEMHWDPATVACSGHRG